MTHPTDEELDALVKRMENVSLQVGVPSRTILDSDAIRRAADSITALRAQIAAANARADRAEAALAAQIEADAGIADNYANQDYCAMGYPEEGGIAASGTADMIRREIRNQPHDRTALDRLLADAEANALRRAAQACDWGDIYGDNAVKCILALIPKDGER